MTGSIFDAQAQLRKLLAGSPNKLREHGIRIDVHGVILDYLARSGNGIEDLLSQNTSLYRYLFPSGFEPPDTTRVLMEAVLRDRGVRSRARSAAKKHGWGELSQIIGQIGSKDRSRTCVRRDSKVDQLANHRVTGVVWQLSDIHFGPLYRLGKDPEQLAGTFGQIVSSNSEFMPRFIIISGDVSSSAQKDELADFVKFCECLSNEVWGEQRPWRILVVPGNHDSTWQTDGTADRLDRFREIVGLSEYAVTPFWPDERTNYQDNLGRVTIHRFDPATTETPPFVLAHDKAIGLRVLLLVSSYYSGCVPDGVRETLDSIRQHHEIDDLTKLLRQDTGEFTEKYLSEIDRGVWGRSERHELSDSMTIAVTHHNLHQYASDICGSPHAPHLRTLLARKQIQLVLHGHTHLTEDRSRERPAASGEAYSVPCPALGCEPAIGSMNGFMLHLISPVGDLTRVSSAVWTISDIGHFEQSGGHLCMRYRFKVYSDRLTVKHVSR